MDDSTILIMIVVTMPVMWIACLWLASCVGGWGKLAAAYRVTDRPAGKEFHFCSAGLGGVANYGACLTFVSTADGLFAVPILPIRPFHPPLFLPWEDIESSDETGWWRFRQVTFRFRQAPDVAFSVGRPVAASLLQAAGRQKSESDSDITAQSG